MITNNLNVAALLAHKADFQVTVAGGVVRARDRGIVGEAAIDLIRQFRVDFGVIGISGIDLDGTLLDFDYQEVRVAQAIIASSRQVFLAADHTKFGRNAMVRLGGLDDVDALFTDAMPPAPVVGPDRQGGGLVARGRGGAGEISMRTGFSIAKAICSDTKTVIYRGAISWMRRSIS